MTDAPQGEWWGRPAAGGSYPSTGWSGGPGAPAGPPTAGQGGAAGGGAPGTPPPSGGSPGDGSGGSKTVFVALAALLVGLLLGGAIGWAVGGSDDDDLAAGSDATSAEWQAYCDRAEELVAEGADDLSDDEEAAAMVELVDLAPERYRSRLDALARLDELEDEPEDIGAAFDLFGDVFGQMMWFVGSLEVECGLDLGDEAFNSVGEDMSGSGTFGFDLDAEFGEESTGTLDEDDLFDDDGDDDGDDEGDDEGDDGPMSLEAIKAHLASEAAGEPWVEAITGWGVVNGSDIGVSAIDGQLSTEDALAACEVFAAYVAEHAPEGSVQVSGGTEVLASGPAGGPCIPGSAGSS